MQGFPTSTTGSTNVGATSATTAPASGTLAAPTATTTTTTTPSPTAGAPNGEPLNQLFGQLMASMAQGGGGGLGSLGGGLGGLGGGMAPPGAQEPVLPPEQRFQIQLEQLTNMGFHDRAANIQGV